MSKTARVKRALAALLTSLAAAACGVPGPQVDGLPEKVDFALHVKPLLSDRCFKCHGPDAASRKTDLRLDVPEIAFARLASGATAIVPGRPGKSDVVRRILSDDPAIRMPSPDSHLTLSDYEKALIIRWIDQGAEWAPHWAFTPPTMPEVPPLPAHARAYNPIDNFVRARADALGLPQAPEASRETLIRRVTLSLTGLPPTIEEVEAFVNDPAPDAYEKLVDRLLASPAYGERMASDWLDIARFADSHGYQDDVMRDMSPWRDWVIDAYNRNLPLDTFITWQLAGDLLPEPTREQRLATAFNRHHMQSQEGGIVPEEYRVEYVADRVQTFGQAFLGLSLDCARCHDHKYDPVTQKEYFQLFAFFNSVNESGQAPYSGMPSPTVVLPSAEAEARLAELEQERRALEAEAAIDNPAYDAAFEAWLALPAREGLIVHLPLDAPRARPVPQRAGRPGAGPTRQLVFANLARPQEHGILGGDPDRIPATVPGRLGEAQRLVGDSEIHAAYGVGFFDRHQPFSLGIWFRIDEPGAAGPLVTRSGGFANGYRGYLVQIEEDGRVTASLHHVAPDDSVVVRTIDPVAPHAWRHLTFTYDGSSRASGLRLFLDGAPVATETVVDNLTRSIFESGIEGNQMSGRPLSLRIGGVGELSKETLRDVSVDDFTMFERQLSALEAAALAGARQPDAPLVTKDPAALTADERAALREHYVLHVSPERARVLARLTAVRDEENKLWTSQPSVMVMRDLPTPRPTFVLARGAYDSPTDRVEPGTPQAILPFPDDLPRNRLGLAQWLLSPQQPLTARVIANRYWAKAFGRGLVATAADFGNQGELPSHPELLDWLATTLVQSGWDGKALHRLIVTSATYRQSSIATPELRERDPENRLLARGPSFRMSAEQIRDAALATSGLLVRKIGGPSVFPYEPPGLWSALQSGKEYPQSTGEGLYRRSLYTAWKRASPPPSAISFDASERLTCTVTRQRTSTPLQALVLLNDPQYVESARVLAEQLVRRGGSPADQVTYGFRRVLSRTPTSSEVELLANLYETEHGRYAADRKAAEALLSTGERPRDPALDPADVAAWTVVASTIMNLDEAVHTR
jgi:hypothetical protein